MVDIGKWLICIEHEQRRTLNEEQLIIGTKLPEELELKIIRIYFQEKYESKWERILNETTDYQRTSS